MKRLVAALLLLATASAGSPAGPPVLIPMDGVPADVQALARTTWGRFIEAVPDRLTCIPPVLLDAAWELDDRARYDPARALVTIRIPGTAPNLAASLLHEFAHHLEFTCPDHRALRPDFLAAQGFAAGTSWFDGPTWEETPSEQYAEAMVEVVLGATHAHARVLLADAAIELVRDWGRGS